MVVVLNVKHIEQQTGSPVIFYNTDVDGPLPKHIPWHMELLLTFSTSIPDYLHSGRTLTSHVWPFAPS